MTNRDNKLIRNSAAEFLIFIGQVRRLYEDEFTNRRGGFQTRPYDAQIEGLLALPAIALILFSSLCNPPLQNVIDGNNHAYQTILA